ncbi:MAG: hypothetical protein LBR80_19055 [Deltaproteobacteria bacterium]|jgi:hypothetical protein|nr:hypothetical protein [Deltaproteobacteria bacterium]
MAAFFSLKIKHLSAGHKNPIVWIWDIPRMVIVDYGGWTGTEQIIDFDLYDVSIFDVAVTPNIYMKKQVSSQIVSGNIII